MSIELTLLLFSVVLFLVLRSLNIRPTSLTGYELRRQAKLKESAKQKLNREKLLPELLTLRYALETILTISIVIFCILLLGWWQGVALAFVVIITIAAIARWGFIGRNIQKLYDSHEKNILQLVGKLQPILKLIRVSSSKPTGDFTIHSKEELIYLVNESELALGPEEKLLLSSGLKFGDRTVDEIMTKRNDVHSIDKKELLGPLVLDDLHKLGHNRLPVTARDIDHVVGILKVENLLTIDGKRSVTAEKAMQPSVFYVHKDQTLSQVLAAFLRTNASLFIVIDKSQKTVGVVSPSDVVETLLGRKLTDKFDKNDDLQETAQYSSQEETNQTRK